MMALLRKHMRAIQFALVAAAVAVGVVACGGGGGSSGSGDGGMQITPPPTLPIGVSQNGSLAREMDPWLVNLTAGTTYRFDMESGDFNARLAIYNNDATPRQLAADDDGGDGTNARLVYRANYTGIHSLRASAVGNASGVYRLSTGTVVIIIEPPSPPVAGNPPSPAPAAPDLIVETPVVDVVTVATGGNFTVSAMVRNDGSGAAVATTLRYYRSTNSTISASDTSVGTDSVSVVTAGGLSEESIALNAPSSSGNYYYGACVDSVAGESNAGNNCSVGVLVTVYAPSDLVVESPVVNIATITAGGSFTLSATVRNAGIGAAAATTLRYYRSPDSTIDTADTFLNIDSSVAALSAGGSGLESISLRAPSSSGNYYYGACVDSTARESNTGNNCSSGVLVVVIPPVSDLVVESPGVDNAIVTGVVFTLRATVRNAGTGAAAATTLSYYRSDDSTIYIGDTAVGTDSVEILSVGEISPESIQVDTTSLAAGTYYYGACVDSVAGESNTGNNCSSAVRVTLLGPDLVVERDTSVSESRALNHCINTCLNRTNLSVARCKAERCTDYRVVFTVRNVGHRVAAATTLRHYRSTTSARNGVLLGTASVGALVSGPDSEVELRMPYRNWTSYHYACVDSVLGETNTMNNCSAVIGGP